MEFCLVLNLLLKNSTAIPNLNLIVVLYYRESRAKCDLSEVGSGILWEL